MNKVKSNIKRCPFLKIIKKDTKYNEKGKIIAETIHYEFNDCYKEYCMAWDEASCKCKYLGSQIIEDDIE